MRKIPPWSETLRARLTYKRGKCRQFEWPRRAPDRLTFRTEIGFESQETPRPLGTLHATGLRQSASTRQIRVTAPMTPDPQGSPRAEPEHPKDDCRDSAHDLVVLDLGPNFHGFRGEIGGTIVCIATPQALHDATERYIMIDLVKRQGGECSTCRNCPIGRDR